MFIMDSQQKVTFISNSNIDFTTRDIISGEVRYNVDCVKSSLFIKNSINNSLCPISNYRHKRGDSSKLPDTASGCL